MIPPLSLTDALRGELLAGSIRPGETLSQNALAARFGVSRIPVRDALQALAGEGLVELGPRGARAISLSRDEVGEIYELRLMLECDLLRRAAARMDRPTIEAIDRVRRKSDIDAATPQWAASDWAFHQALYAPAGRTRHMALVEGLRRTCQLHVGAYAAMPQATARWLDDHRTIVEHLAAGEPVAAVDALARHIEEAGRHLAARMETAAPD